MSLKFLIDSLDGLEDSVKELYEDAGDGKYQLKVEGIPSEKAGDDDDVKELKQALERERQNAAKARRESSEFRKLGLDPEEVAELQRQREEAERKKLKDEGEFEKLLNQHKEKWEGEKATLTKERDDAVAALKTHVGESAFVTELAKLGATEEGVSLLPLRFKERIRVDIADGRPVVEVLASDGETPMAGTAKDGRATLTDLVEEAAKSYPSLFKAQGKGGGGKPPSGGDGGKPNRKFEEMSGADLKALRESNPEEYKRLADDYKQRTS